MKLEAGKFYKRRNGEIVGPVKFDDTVSCYPFYVGPDWSSASERICWYADGSVSSFSPDDPYDLVAEHIPEPTKLGPGPTIEEVRHAELLAALKSIEDVILLGALQAPVKESPEARYYAVIDRDGAARTIDTCPLDADRACSWFRANAETHSPYRIAVLREVTP